MKENKTSKNLKILLTPGDAAGIGSEVALKSEVNRSSKCDDLGFIGPKWLWQQIASHFSLPEPENILEVPALKNIPETKISFGKVERIWGEIAMECVRFAAQTCLKNQADAMVTAPLTKAGIHLAGYKYQGHTDFLAEITKTSKHAMMLSSKNLRVLMVTHHQSLKSVSESLSIENIFEKIELANLTGKKFGIDNPKIAVCGLNPHSGENGAFGIEEIKFISPAILKAKNLKINVKGPVPADTVFLRAVNGEFDFVIAMYHDQGLIPVKLHDFEKGVNTTLGLPIVRTSPGHGSAYDIAGTGIANETSMIEAIKMAKKLTTKREPATQSGSN